VHAEQSPQLMRGPLGGGLCVSESKPILGTGISESAAMVTDVETIATGTAIRELPRLRGLYGRGRWRKRKGTAQVELTGGVIALPKFTGTKRLV
jgi:hypothetical protein